MKAFLLLAFLCAAAPLAAEEPLILSVQAEVLPSTTVAAAEPAEVRITASGNQKIFISSLTVPESDAWSLLDHSVSQPEPGAPSKWETRIRMRLLPLSLGEIVFPSLKVPYRTEEGKNFAFDTPPVKIAAVASGLPPQAGPDLLKDIRGPLRAGPPPWLLWAAGCALLGAAAAALFFSRRKPPEGPRIPAPPLQPWDEAALEKLEQAWKRYRSDGDVKKFYSEISLLFRAYLASLYSLETLEKTTSEIFQGMRQSGLDRKIALEVRDILSGSDLVKFAKLSPVEKETEAEYERLKAFILRTRPAPPAAQGAAQP